MLVQNLLAKSILQQHAASVTLITSCNVLDRPVAHMLVLLLIQQLSLNRP